MRVSDSGFQAAKISIEDNGICSVAGRMDIASLQGKNIKALDELLSLRVRKHLQIDFSELQSADSVLLAAILELARSAKASGGSIILKNFPPKLLGLAVTYGIDSLIEPYCE